MAESSVDIGDIPCNSGSIQNEIGESCEPEKKKIKLNSEPEVAEYKLEERLNGILCCAVCLDLPSMSVYQCTNGHLMCASCLSHLLADARLKDESATCPNCRCEISKNVCTRNLAVEKAISELPSQCQFCSKQLPRSGLAWHERELCQERLVPCKFERIGCPWQGPFHELDEHQSSCVHPRKSGEEVMEALKAIDTKMAEQVQLYKDIFKFLSFEKITFSDLQLRPYRTDDFITKLFYETSRFSAFNCQWVVKARVNDNQKNPALTVRRSLNYQLVLKSKLQNPMRLHYVALKGPYGEMHLSPAIYDHEFSNDNPEAPLKMLPLGSGAECNKLLAAKTISIRLILFHVQK